MSDLAPKPQNAPIGAPTAAGKAAEVVHVAVPDGASPTGATTALAAVEPTQVRRPWRATARTVFAAVVGLAAMLPLLVDASGLDETSAPIGGALAIAAAVTRVMALPQVETFLQRFLPWLAAAPKP